jgi:uncharacterized SAM-binding protein YcdF (DUF218 family)
VASKIILTGSGDNDFIRRRLLLSGVPEEAILVENLSGSTKENAEFTARLLREQGIRNVILVTSWYHSRRALRAFRHFAPEAEFHSMPAYHGQSMATKPALAEMVWIYQEYLKTGWYCICYGIIP